MYTGYISTDPEYLPLIQSLGVIIVRQRNEHDYDCLVDRATYEKLREYEGSDMFYWKLFDNDGRFPVD